ncbi:hypothetical protein [Sporomusa sp.]|uniref:hypothetical protein n=1 Tax=Sporomusa sp. TaxID=2078658 RepID=UPI002CF9A047|nr:hypothetical protein [Sporomusa sp.]HWR07765.1 hypothetical protein [Sporomusa sp.]
MNQYRYAVVNGQTIPFDQIRQGQLFYLHEPDGTLLGKYIADSDAYINLNRVWQVDCTSQPLG